MIYWFCRARKENELIENCLIFRQKKNYLIFLRCSMTNHSLVRFDRCNYNLTFFFDEGEDRHWHSKSESKLDIDPFNPMCSWTARFEWSSIDRQIQFEMKNLKTNEKRWKCHGMFHLFRMAWRVKFEIVCRSFSLSCFGYNCEMKAISKLIRSSKWNEMRQRVFDRKAKKEKRHRLRLKMNGMKWKWQIEWNRWFQWRFWLFHFVRVEQKRRTETIGFDDEMQSDNAAKWRPFSVLLSMTHSKQFHETHDDGSYKMTATHLSIDLQSHLLFIVCLFRPTQNSRSHHSNKI